MRRRESLGSETDEPVLGTGVPMNIMVEARRSAREQNIESRSRARAGLVGWWTGCALLLGASCGGNDPRTAEIAGDDAAGSSAEGPESPGAEDGAPAANGGPANDA